jgi:hypothetical protein
MGKVAALKTAPTTVLSDCGWLMRSIGYTGVLSKDFNTVIKLNLSWTMLGQHVLVCSRFGRLLPCTLHKKKGCAADR